MVLLRFDYLIKIENVIFIFFIKLHNCASLMVTKEIKCRFDPMSGPAAHVASPSIQFPLKFLSALAEGPYTAGIVVWFCHSAQCGNLQLMNV